MPAPKHEFGDTCPVLNVAKKHGVSYEQALAMAHYYKFGKSLPGTRETMASLAGTDKIVELSNDLCAVVLRMVNLQSGRETFP